MSSTRLFFSSSLLFLKSVTLLVGLGSHSVRRWGFRHLLYITFLCNVVTNDTIKCVSILYIFIFLPSQSYPLPSIDLTMYVLMSALGGTLRLNVGVSSTTLMESPWYGNYHRHIDSSMHKSEKTCNGGLCGSSLRARYATLLIVPRHRAISVFLSFRPPRSPRTFTDPAEKLSSIPDRMKLTNKSV